MLLRKAPGKSLPPRQSLQQNACFIMCTSIRLALDLKVYICVLSRPKYLRLHVNSQAQIYAQSHKKNRQFVLATISGASLDTDKTFEYTNSSGKPCPALARSIQTPGSHEKSDVLYVPDRLKQPFVEFFDAQQMQKMLQGKTSD